MQQKSDEEIKKILREENLQKIRNKIVVMSGKGGVGKSTVSVNLAYGLAMAGYITGIMDVDFHGPSIVKMTGIEGRKLKAGGEDGRPSPVKAADNLYVLSIASMLESPDDPVIWRGPMKIGVIQQFLEDISWPELDYLIIDCPPGTGDEPLSVIQTLENVTGAVIVSTPQDMAFLDVRKSINFVNKLNVPILGMIENMAGFVCPKCGEMTDIFKGSGAKKASSDFNIDILGQIPINPEIVSSGDSGKPYVYFNKNTETGKIYCSIIEKIISKTKKLITEKKTVKDDKIRKIAIPVDNDKLSGHFGHASKFIIYYIDAKGIIRSEFLNPPPHEPGSIPKWLSKLGVSAVLVGGIGQGAIDYFNQYKVDVISGCNELPHNEIIQLYLEGKLISKDGTCSHNHGCH